MKLSFQLILLSLTKFELYRAEFSCDEIFPAGVKEKISLSCREYLQNIDFDSSDNSSENKQVNDDGEGNGDEGNGDEGNGDEGVDPVGSDGDLLNIYYRPDDEPKKHIASLQWGTILGYAYTSMGVCFAS